MDEGKLKLWEKASQDHEIDVALEIKNIYRTYSQGNLRLDVLKGVDFKIKPGEMVALVGPSGSGKSTLLHLAGLIEKPTSGSIFLRGMNCAGLTDAARTQLRLRDIGFIYQFHHLLPEFTALENVMVPQLIAGLNKTEAIERANLLLDMVGLSSRVNHRPSRLSGGEQQRVAIVRSIANVPRVVLADEPTGNLDPETSIIVFQQLREIIHRSKIAMLVATHNMELASKMDRIVAMEGGKIRQLNLGKK